jgi:hypothetical protein
MEKNNWIDVKEKLPELDVDVLTAYYCDSKVNGRGFWVIEIGSVTSITRRKSSSGEKEYADWHIGDDYDTNRPTHWQPLPDPPVNLPK